MHTSDLHVPPCIADRDEDPLEHQFVNAQAALELSDLRQFEMIWWAARPGLGASGF